MTVKNQNSMSAFFFKDFYFRERGREGERGGEKHQWLPSTCTPNGTEPATQACAPTGNRTGMMPNQLSHIVQGSMNSYGSKRMREIAEKRCPQILEEG